MAGIVTAVVYWRQNRSIKESEAAQSKVEAQKAEIELADLYRQKMLEMMELMNAKQDKGNFNQEKMLQKLDNIDSRVDGLEVRVANIEGCMNGTTGDIHPPEREQGETTIIAGNVDGGGVRFIDIINDIPI